MNRIDKNKITVIVPVYKAEKYIEACVCSILAQTFTDFELILVDDGSPDQTGAICDKLAKTDSRIRVIHKENGGAATARNAGLDAATGDFIAFVDGDDLIHPQYLEFLLRNLLDHKADIAMCHYHFFEEGEDPYAFDTKSLSDPTNIWHGPQLLASFRDYYHRVSLISLCMKLFKKEIFDGLRIPEGFIEEDSMSLPHILERAQTIVRSQARLYFWRVTPGSVTHSGFSAKTYAHIEVSRYQAEFLAARNHSEAAFFQQNYLKRVLKYYYKTVDEAPQLMPTLKPYLKQYRQLFPRYIRANGLCAREKAAYTLFLVCPAAARGLYETVYKEENSK